MDEELSTQSRPVIRRRIPKACNPCRQSKVKCDGKKPCTRCQHLTKTCVFIERSREISDEKYESLEKEVQHLRQLLEAQQNALVASSGLNDDSQHTLRQPQHFTDGLPRQSDSPSSYVNPTSPYYGGMFPNTAAGVPRRVASASTGTDIQEHGNHPQSTNSAHNTGSITRKRKRPHFEISYGVTPDFVAEGLISLDQAQRFFQNFFSGCDRFVPIFDPDYDTFESIRARSSLLLNSICAVGCAVENEKGSQLSLALSFELKKWISVLIMGQQAHCLETVQALLVTACYSSDRSLILSFATRMALDLELPRAYDELTTRLVTRESNAIYEGSNSQADDLAWMRQTRTWFCLLVLEHILRVDAGKFPGLTLKGGVRRCRVLLDYGISTALDLRLFSQVELNCIRAKIHDSLNDVTDGDDLELTEVIRDAKIDIDVWFRDWQRTVESSSIASEEAPSLLLNLKVQKHWAETMAICKVVRSMGIENVSGMSTTGRNLLLMAKSSLKHHLTAMVSEPQNYLASFKYAMDFVWAKCAFSFLLLLKLNRLLPDPTDEYERLLLSQGNQLLAELNKFGTSGGSSTSRLYLQVLNSSIEKHGRALQERQGHNNPTHQQGPSSAPSEIAAANASVLSPFWDTRDAQAELDSFIPEQFMFEWDFPGLNLFSSPVSWDDFFDEFLLGNNGDSSSHGFVSQTAGPAQQIEGEVGNFGYYHNT